MRGCCEVKPENGTKRTITKFALLPVCTQDNQWRWLERVTVEQEFDCSYSNYDDWSWRWWKNMRFVNE